ncbi:MAG TPA: cyclic nucleotide-binding domain-containing protein [Anaerolineaceae bacterium]|nr:cyclic nucleotide-binding domain-containing protein [Anaerolineaceae bacterium]HPN52194.1 cyclic nucleotide-binding domain-containing protein [Anaerolineaceae bacterium]
MDSTFDTFTPLRQAFPGITESEAREMVNSGTIKTIPPETIICHEGALENTFYIILSGEVKVTKKMGESEERLMKTLHSGDFFGEMAIIHNAPRAATVSSITETVVVELVKDTFTRLLEGSSIMSLSMVREVSRRLRENDEMAIGDLRLKARQLAEAYQQLAEQDFARREFLTTIAHELRTPLMAANGFLQVVRSGMLKGEALNSAMDTIARNLLDITSLVNDILFLQEMDLILPEFQPTDIGAVVAATVERQRERASRNHVGLQLNIVPDLPPVQADAKSLERAFTAILDNSIKFSPDGGEVLIEVTTTPSCVTVTFCDHGVGIPPENLDKIFNRFFHVDKIGNYLFRGAGLGLSIARQVIEQHSGEILVQSVLGSGSTFSVILPKKR